MPRPRSSRAGRSVARCRGLTRYQRLRRNQLPLESARLARFLLGTILVGTGPHGQTAARIVETEAYVPGDAASHAYRGPTPRNRSMFLRRGHAYVYFIYGTSYCLNVASEDAGVGAAVLLRAAEPLRGLEVMRERRGGCNDRLLCRGPGRLAAAFALTRLYDGLDLCSAGPLWLAAGSPPERIGKSVRIGVRKEAARALRFFEYGSAFVSGPTSLNRMHVEMSRARRT